MKIGTKKDVKIKCSELALHEWDMYRVWAHPSSVMGWDIYLYQVIREIYKFYYSETKKCEEESFLIRFSPFSRSDLFLSRRPQSVVALDTTPNHAGAGGSGGGILWEGAWGR